MSNYRDDVREMMRQLKNKKEALPNNLTESSSTMSPSTAPISDDAVPDEEELFDDILDLVEEGASSAVVDDNEAEQLLRSSPTPAEPVVEDKVTGENDTSESCPVSNDTKDDQQDESKESKNEPENESNETSNNDDENVDNNSDSDDKDAVTSVKDEDEDETEELESKADKKDNDQKSLENSGKENESSSDDDIQAIEKTPAKRTSARVKSKSQKTEPEPEVVELSSNDDDDDKNDDDESSESSEEEDVDEVGDPKRAPGEGASKTIPADYLQPFLFGWRREVIFRRSKASSVTHCEVLYIPPQDGRYRTREAKRKRKSKADQERYFEDFPDDNLSIKNFNYVRKALGLENAAYEIIRQGKYQEEEDESSGKKSMKEVEESAGLLEDSDGEDEEITLIMGFDMDMPISLQAAQHTTGMHNEFKKRRKTRDPETCCTPPLAEDSLWTNLDDDPFGVFSDLGGRSSPVTPPPLRAVKLTYSETADRINEAIQKVKDEAFKFDATKETDLVEDLASHDAAIKKFKNFKTSTTIDPTWYPTKRAPQQPQFRGGQHQAVSRGLSSSLIMRPTMDRPCTPKCPGSYGILPSLQCVMCKHMYHAKCQGQISPKLRVFRCRKCLSRLGATNHRQQSVGGRSVLASSAGYDNNASVKLKLPMLPKNGKRPIVELVLRTTEGRYQPIKFRNNSQITETISRSLFHKANQARKTLYVKSQMLPRLNGKPVFLAINPIAQPQQQPSRVSPAQQPSVPQGDQVAILVRPQKAAANSKPVLLNVPRKVALKVKVGTTLSFSASNDHKYVVMDSKIHPPVGNRARPAPAGPAKPRLPLPASLSVIPNRGPGGRPGPASSANLANLVNRKRPGITVTRTATSSPVRGPPAAKVARLSRPALPTGSNVLASGEVVSSRGAAAATEPCTPYCPGVTGFPDLECTRCQSLFHSKCVGIHESILNRIRSSFKCRICTPTQPAIRQAAVPRVGPKSRMSRGGGRAAGSSVTVINLD